MRRARRTVTAALLLTVAVALVAFAAEPDSPTVGTLAIVLGLACALLAFVILSL